MICPFCMETVRDTAVVCKFCRHDLTYVRQLQSELMSRDERIAALEQALAAKADIAPPQTAEEQEDTRGHPVIDAASARSVALPARHSQWADYWHSAVAFLVPFLLLVGTQYAFVFWLDLHVVLLRAMMIILPLGWGLRYRWLRTAPRAAIVVIAVLLGLTSVLAMLVITSVIDGTPILPDNRHDRIETIQVILSVILGFGCGVLVARVLAGLRANADRMRAGYSSAIGAVKNSTREPERFGMQADIAQKLIEFTMPILSGVGAVLAGVLSLLR